MELIFKAFGDVETNCYILKTNQGDIIIDPGINATNWVVQNVTNPLCILITHGHYDHIWSLSELKIHFPNVLIYCPSGDEFMLESDCFNTGLNPCPPDFIIPFENFSYVLKFLDLEITYLHFPGHTPGCSIIKIGDFIFSGDFIFKRCIGRYDFPYSNSKDMKKSLIRFQQMPSFQDMIIYPGHGEATSLIQEQQNVAFWIQRIRD